MRLDMLKWVALSVMCSYELCSSAVMPVGGSEQISVMLCGQLSLQYMHAGFSRPRCQDLEALQIAAGYPCKHARASNLCPGPVQAENLYVNGCTYSDQSCMRKVVGSCAQPSRGADGALYLPVLIWVTFSGHYRMYDRQLRLLHGVQGI